MINNINNTENKCTCCYNTICPKCSTINESNNYISNISFDNQIVNGRFGNMNSEYSSLMQLRSFSQNNSLIISEIRLNKSYKIIDLLCSNLGLSDLDNITARRYFKLVLSKNWLQGRRTWEVAAVCAYAACRKNNTPILLIDFSDYLGTGLKRLATTFLKLCRFLRIGLPPIEPELLIFRFCSKLKLGENESKISKFAIKILKSMKRDWILIGRRPAGVVAAAIAISCRVFGYKRNNKQIGGVINVCDETIRKRLIEFKKTETAKIKYEQIDDLENIRNNPMNPPSYKIAMKAIENIEKLKLENNNKKELINDNTLTQDYDNLDDKSDEEINSYILSKEEVQLKEKIWNNLNKDWINEQNIKNNNKIIKEKAQKKQNINNKIINAKDVVSAVLDFSKVSGKLDSQVINDLFK